MTRASCAPETPLGTRGDQPLDPRSILTSLGEVVYDWDITTDRLSWGLNVSDVLGFSRGQSIRSGRTFAAFIEPGSGQTRHDVIVSGQHEHGDSGGSYRTRYGLKTRSDRLLVVEDSGRWFPGSDGRPASAHGVLRVVRPNAHSAADFTMRDDNRDRAVVAAELEAVVEEGRRVGRPTTLMVAAVDDVAQLNESVGYEAADEVLSKVRARLQAVMRGRDKLTRYGNRFVLLLPSCSADQVEIAAARFTRAVERLPIETPTGSVGAVIKIGAAITPDHGPNVANLLRCAEEALSEARRCGTPHLVYSAHLGKSILRRRAEGAGLDLVAALNERRIRIARQPVVEARSRRRAFDEVLMRIERRDGTLVAASDVVPTAEKLGLIRLVDYRVLELASACLAREPDSRLAINVSALTLKDPDWLVAFTAQLGARPGVADRLILEITETAAIEDIKATRALLSGAKALGVSIAIDDFGAGYTSFRHLRDFPLDIIKIDGAFVQNLSRSTDDRFFVRTLLDLARQLGVSVVAEWVESEEAAVLLTEWGVDYLQGDAVGGPAEVDVPTASEKSVA